MTTDASPYVPDEALIAAAKAKAAELYPDGLPDTTKAQINAIFRDANDRIGQKQAT